MKQLTLAIPMILATLALSACKDIGPAELNVQVDRTFDLETVKDKRLVLEAGSQTPVTVDLDGSKVKLTFANDQKVIFKNAKFDKKTEKAVVEAAKSGQKTSQGERLGLEIGRIPLCEPNCVDTHVTTRDQGCVGCDYEWVERCHWENDRDDHGGSWDRDRRRASPGRNRGRRVCRREHVCVRQWAGTQTVTTTTKISHYTVDGRIFGQKQGTLAVGLGTYDEVDTSSYTSSCN